MNIPDKQRVGRLVAAAEKGDLSILKALIAKGIDLDQEDKDFHTALCQAAAKNQVEVVKLLIKNGANPNKIGANPNSSSRCGSTPLSYAATLEIAKILYDAGADIQDPRVPLLQARKNVRVLKWLAKQGVDLCKPIRGGSLLFEAQSPETATYLLSLGLDPNETRFGRALLEECRNAATSVVLLKHGADLKKLSSDVMEYTAMSCNGDKLAFLIDHGFAFDNGRIGASLLIRASHVNNVSIAEFLLKKGVSPDAVELWHKDHPDSWTTPLETTAIFGHADVAKILIKFGARVSFTCKTWHLRPLSIAMKNRHHEIAQVLWEAGARDTSDLAYFTFQGALDKVRTLLQSGSALDPDKPNQFSALYFAALENRMEFAKLLLQHGADLERSVILPGGKMTPLSAAASEGHYEMVKFLLDHKAKPTLEALEQALNNSDPYGEQRPVGDFIRTITILLNAGIPVKGSDIVTSAIYTRHGGSNPDAVRLLLERGAKPNPHLPFGNGKNLLDVLKEEKKKYAGTLEWDERRDVVLKMLKSAAALKS